MRKHLPFWSFILIVSVAFAQQKQSPFCGLTSLQGLSESTNTYVFKDSQGFVWVSSIDGLNRFDGRKAKVFKPDPKDPNAIYGGNIQSAFFEDSKGDIWFTTEKAVNCYRRQKGEFEHFTLHLGAQTGIDQSHYAFYLDGVEKLWMSVSDSLFIFDTQRPTATDAFTWVSALPKAARCALSEMDGIGKRLFVSFWAYGPGFEMINFDQFGAVVDRHTWFDDQGVICYKVVSDKQGRAWFATNKGLLAYDPADPKGGRLLPLKEGNGGIRSLDWSGEKQLVVVSMEGNLWFFNTQTSVFEFQGKLSANVEGQLTEIQAKSVNVTTDQLIWCSAPGKGVYYSGLKLRHFEHPMQSSQKENLDFSQIYEDESGQIWSLTFNDLSYQFDSKGRFKKTLALPKFPALCKNAAGKTQLFSSTGWEEVSPEAATWKKLSSNPSKITPVNNCVLSWSPNILLIGTTKGLCAVSAQTGVIQELPFSRDGTTALFIDKNGLVWVGSSDQLVVFKLLDNLTAQRLATYEHTGIVNQIAQDRLVSSTIWVGTANGLLKVNALDWQAVRIGEQDGLPNEYIQSLVPDQKGRVWLGTNKGIVRYQPLSALKEQFQLYDRRNGLASNEYCRGAALLASNGRVWFAGKEGLDTFSPDSIHDNGTPPKLAIVGLKIHDQEWHSDTMSIEMANRIDLAYNENTLRIELAALEYTDPEMNKFRVRLLNNGNDTAWVELGTQNFITYANLRPGHYQFQLTACNSEGIWQEYPRTLALAIHPHFTDTWWFKSLMAALALAFIGFGTAFYYRYRLRLQQLALEKQQREAERKQLLLENELSLQQERNRIADEMHDELGGGLSTIRLASERAKRIQSPDELQTVLKRVSQISIGLVNNMRGIIWAMDSQNDSLSSLLAYVRQYAGMFLDDNAITAKLELPSDFPDRSLSSQYRHNIMLTVKECLNNILKHADATAVELNISVGAQLLISIRDNGKGFEPGERAGKGKGLRTTVKRMESVGGHIEWQRNAAGGMTVNLTAPLP